MGPACLATPNDHNPAGPSDPPLPYSGNRRRRLPLQAQQCSPAIIRRRRETKLITSSLRLKPKWVSLRWKWRVSSAWKLTTLECLHGGWENSSTGRFSLSLPSFQTRIGDVGRPGEAWPSIEWVDGRCAVEAGEKKAADESCSKGSRPCRIHLSSDKARTVRRFARWRDPVRPPAHLGLA